MTQELWGQITQLGLAAMLVAVFLVMLMRGDIRLGREYTTLEKDRDFWREAAMRVQQHAGTAVTVAERVTGERASQ